MATNATAAVRNGGGQARISTASNGIGIAAPERFPMPLHDVMGEATLDGGI